MIFVDLVLGPGDMILLGLALTLVITVRRMMAMNLIKDEYNVQEVLLPSADTAPAVGVASWSCSLRRRCR